MAAIVALLLGGAPAAAQTWHADVAGAGLVEAWDHNESHEWLAGGVAGLDRVVWRGVAARGEVVLLKVAQRGGDAWLRGFTVGTRLRGRGATARPFLDVAVGLSEATRPVPPRGTAFNYLAVVGGGVEAPRGRLSLSVSARWLHASNNGREGRARNPDIQALGAVIGIGWIQK